MDVKSLVPSFGSRSASQPTKDMDPFMAVRYEMNRLFDDLFSGFGLPGLALPRAGSAAILTPQIDVSETENEIQITADLPGIDEKNVEVLVADDLLTIRGEKEAEHEEKERGYRLIERASGTFSRFIRLPFSVDPGQVQAAFKNGVLTVTIPKPKEARDKVHRIEVKAGDGAEGHGSSASAEPSSTGGAQGQAAAA